MMVCGHIAVTLYTSSPSVRPDVVRRIYSRIRKVLIPWLVTVLGLAIADVLLCIGVMIIMIVNYVHYIIILLG